MLGYPGHDLKGVDWQFEITVMNQTVHVTAMNFLGLVYEFDVEFFQMELDDHVIVGAMLEYNCDIPGFFDQDCCFSVGS